MDEPWYERLTQLDNSFLVYEDTLPAVAAHVASTQILDAAPLRGKDGVIDIERIEEYVVSRLDDIPRYRQVLANTPIEGHPVWVDDHNFNIHYHVRHTRLPNPGSERQLKRLIGRIFSTRLDRSKPLWELWMIEGLEGDRVAMMSKVHHCMVDGVSGAALLAALLTPGPIEKAEPARIWKPRPRPKAYDLGVGEVARLARAPFDALNGLLQIASNEDGARDVARERLQSLSRTMGDMSGATPMPFNQPIGPHRRIDWMPMSIAQIKDIRKAFGGTLNDVVLAVATGGFRRFLSRERTVDLHDVCFRAMTPVNTRQPDEDRSPSNRVATWTIELPVGEPDPVERLRQICKTTTDLKESHAAEGTEVITQASEWTGSGVMSVGLRLMMMATPMNTVITNVPGPQMPLFLLNAPLREIHPLVPLVGNMAIGMALLSCDGRLSGGVSSDWDLVPVLPSLVEAMQRSFEGRLHAAAEARASED